MTEIEIEERVTEDELASGIVANIVAVTVTNLGPAEAARVIRKVGEIIREFDEDVPDQTTN